MKLKKRTMGHWLFIFSLFLFIIISGSIAKGETDYLSKMDVSKREGFEAPKFILPDQDGRKTALREFQGRLVMLNFWATW